MDYLDHRHERTDFRSGQTAQVYDADDMRRDRSAGPPAISVSQAASSAMSSNATNWKGLLMPVIVRRMGEADRSSWARMRHQMWDSLSIQEHMDDIAKMCAPASKRRGYIAVRDGERPVGFAEVHIREYANGCTAQPVPFLEGIWVEPEYRRHDVGRMLVNEIRHDLIAEGFKELCSDAHVENTISHRAHEKWGFDETDRVVYFRKTL